MELNRRISGLNNRIVDLKDQITVLNKELHDKPSGGQATPSAITYTADCGGGIRVTFDEKSGWLRYSVLPLKKGEELELTVIGTSSNGKPIGTLTLTDGPHNVDFEEAEHGQRTHFASIQRPTCQIKSPGAPR